MADQLFNTVAAIIGIGVGTGMVLLGILANLPGNEPRERFYGAVVAAAGLLILWLV